MDLNPNLYLYLMVSAVMFSIGIIGVLTRKNAIVVFMCIELMLNAVNLSLVSFSRFLDNGAVVGKGMVNPASDGSMLVFFVMCVAAAEAVVGLAIIIALFRNKQNIDVNNFKLFKW